MSASPAQEAVIIANPAAGSVLGPLVEEVAARCGKYVQSVRTYWTASRGDATGEVVRCATARPLGSGLLLMVAVGGDGTVLEVARGMVEASARGFAGQALFVVPGGTGNSNYRALAGELPWEEALERSLSALPESITRVDLAQSPELGDLIVLGAGAGLTAEVMSAARGLQLTGRAKLAAGLERAVTRFTPYDGRVSVDGTPLYEGPTVLANVGGSPYRAWQYQVLPYSLLDDGLLDVCVVSGAIPPADVPALLLAGEHVGRPGVFYGRGETVVIERTDGAPLCFEHDGELAARVSHRYTIQVRASALAALRPPLPAATGR